MPQVDIPLPELEKYSRRNPYPTISTLTGRKRSRKCTPSGRDARSSLKLPSTCPSRKRSTGNLSASAVRVHAKYLRPTNIAGPHPLVLQFHGYTHHSGDWNDKLNYVAWGFSVAALDCRGQDGLSEDRGGVVGNTHNGQIIRGLGDLPEKLYYRAAFCDTAQLARVVLTMPEVDADRVGAQGGSQGGGLTLDCAALEPALRRIAPVLPFLCEYKRVWKMDMAKGAYNEILTYFRLFDPRHERESAVWERLEYIDCQHLAPKIEAETLFFVGLMDTTCPPSTQFAAYNRITARKRTVIYPDFGHEGLPGSNDLIYNFLGELKSVCD